MRSAANANEKSKLEWRDVPEEMIRRCALVEIYGDTDTGRSTLALTGPGPIAYIHGHEKIDGLINRARQRTEVRDIPFAGPMRGDADKVMDIAEADWSRVERHISDAYTWARTIVLDTHTVAWEIIQLARLGSLNRDERNDADQRRGQLVYAEINARWKALFSEFRAHAEEDNRTNLILIGRTKEEYKKVPGSSARQATGKTISAGQKETGFHCDVRLRTNRSKEGVYSATIEKPWMAGELRGMEIDSTEDSVVKLALPEIMGLITGTDPDEWS